MRYKQLESEIEIHDTTKPLNETNGGSENLQTYSLMLESNSSHPTLAQVFDIHEGQSVAPEKEDENSPFNKLCEYLHWLKRDSIKSLSMTHAVSRNYPSLHFLLTSTINRHQEIARLSKKPQVNSNSLFYQCCEAIVSNPRSANGLRQLDGAPGIYYAGGGSYRLFIAYPKMLLLQLMGYCII